jgi:hypothetical protein
MKIKRSLLVIVVMLGAHLARAQGCPTAASGQKSTVVTSELTEAVLQEIQKVERKIVAAAEDFPEKLYNTYRPKANKDTAADIVLTIADFNATSAFQVSTKEQQDAVAAVGRIPDDRNFTYRSKQDTVMRVKESFAAVRKAIQDNPDPQNLEDWLFVVSFSSEHLGRLETYYTNNGLKVPDARQVD